MPDYRLLVNLANRIIQDGQACLNLAMRRHGLSSPEANVLMFLYTSGDGVRQDSIVSGIDVSKAAISRTVASLERKGLIMRTRSQSDRRSYQIILTDKARELQGYIQRRYEDMIRAAAEGIPDQTVEESIQVFERVAENLSRYREQLAAVTAGC